jgi:predicted nuclease of predicted toxin-antitoxin system
MKFTLDENIGERGAALLRAAGHDVVTVSAQNLSATTDENLFAVCAREQRTLITLDHEFGYVLRFLPEHSAGIVVLETAPSAQADTILALIRDFIRALSKRAIENELWIVEPGRLRLHQSGD